MIVPSVIRNKFSCTAIYNIKEQKWTKLEEDERNAPFNGILDRWWGHKNGPGLVYFGGYEKGKSQRDKHIWLFYDLKHGWKKTDFTLPEHVRQNATKIVTVHPDFCNPT